MDSDPRRQSGDGETVAERNSDRLYGQRLENEPESGRYAARRGWLSRTTDEVTAWFGNTDAMRRRQRDEAVGDHTGEGPKTSGDPDTLILDQVNQRLTLDSELNASNIEVSVLAGAVTLGGAVTTSADKSRAEYLAAAVTGVSQVRNNLLVS